MGFWDRFLKQVFNVLWIFIYIDFIRIYSLVFKTVEIKLWHFGLFVLFNLIFECLTILRVLFINVCSGTFSTFVQLSKTQIKPSFAASFWVGTIKSAYNWAQSSEFCFRFQLMNRMEPWSLSWGFSRRSLGERCLNSWLSSICLCQQIISVWDYT